MNNSNMSHAGHSANVQPTSFAAQDRQHAPHTSTSTGPARDSTPLLHQYSSTQSASMQGHIESRQQSMPQSSGRYRFQMPSPTAVFPKQFGDPDKSRSVSQPFIQPKILSGQTSTTNNSGLYYITTQDNQGNSSLPQSSLPTLNTMQSHRSRSKSKEKKKRSR